MTPARNNCQISFEAKVIATVADPVDFILTFVNIAVFNLESADAGEQSNASDQKVGEKNGEISEAMEEVDIVQDNEGSKTNTFKRNVDEVEDRKFPFLTANEEIQLHRMVIILMFLLIFYLQFTRCTSNTDFS